MSVTNYVVPHEGFGDPRRLTVDNVDPELFLDLLAESGQSQLITVTLCGHSSSGFRVRHDETVVGTISTAQSEDYRELDWVIYSGLSPQVTASIGLCQDCEDDSTPVFEVLLPEPGLCVPCNNPPAQRWGMLEGDSSVRVVDLTSNVDALPASSAHMLVSLKNKCGVFHRHIQVFADDSLIATIPRQEAAWLADSITALNNDGLVAVARAYYSAGSGMPSLTIFADEAAPNGKLSLWTAGALAAATAGTAIAVARAEASAATASAPFAGASPAPNSPTISLNSVEPAPASKGLDSTLAGTSTGLKLACAASVAVIIGGTANFAASLVSLHSSNDHVTGSALEAYHNPHISPRAAGAHEAEDTEDSDATGDSADSAASGNSEPSRSSVNTGNSVAPQSPESTAPHRMDSDSARDNRRTTNRDVISTDRAASPTDSAGITRTDGERGTDRAVQNNRAPQNQVLGNRAPENRSFLGDMWDFWPQVNRAAGGADSDSTPRRSTNRDTAATTSPSTTSPTPTGQDRTPSGQDRAPVGDDRSMSEEDRFLVPFMPMLPPGVDGGEEPTEIPAIPLVPAITSPATSPEPTPQETPEDTTPATSPEPTPQETPEDTTPATSPEPTPQETPEDTTPEPEPDEVAEEWGDVDSDTDPETVEPSPAPNDEVEPQPEPEPQPETTDTPQADEPQKDKPQKDKDLPPGQRKKLERGETLGPGQLKKLERGETLGPGMRNR